ncbi:hypothetical protein [Acidovorax phage ACPWH]|nr:hypothetical protein [Acidovorax phage ACPWH]QXV72218.1 hypothetical protein Acf1_00021 [Acidovorax phage ACF1]
MKSTTEERLSLCSRVHYTLALPTFEDLAAESELTRRWLRMTRDRRVADRIAAMRGRLAAKLNVKYGWSEKKALEFAFANDTLKFAFANKTEPT